MGKPMGKPWETIGKWSLNGIYWGYLRILSDLVKDVKVSELKKRSTVLFIGKSTVNKPLSIAFGNPFFGFVPMLHLLSRGLGTRARKLGERFSGKPGACVALA